VNIATAAANDRKLMVLLILYIIPYKCFVNIMILCTITICISDRTGTVSTVLFHFASFGVAAAAQQSAAAAQQCESSESSHHYRYVLVPGTTSVGSVC
jgi:hypothetical protein